MKPLPRRTLLSLVVWTTLAHAGSSWADSAPPEVAGTLKAARLLGRGALTFFGLHVYDARLWVGAAAPPADWQTVPFALELIYARSVVGSKIAERSLTEMQRQADIEPEVAQRWSRTMKALFPDVQNGDRMTGVNLPGQGARFFVNGGLRGLEPDAEFARLFFGIWLSPQTSEPALRKALLGPAA